MRRGWGRGDAGGGPAGSGSLPVGRGLPQERGRFPPPGSGNHVTPPGCSVPSTNQRAGIACIPLGQWGAARRYVIAAGRAPPRHWLPPARAPANRRCPSPRNHLAPAASQPVASSPRVDQSEWRSPLTGRRMDQSQSGAAGPGRAPGGAGGSGGGGGRWRRGGARGRWRCWHCWRCLAQGGPSAGPELRSTCRSSASSSTAWRSWPSPCWPGRCAAAPGATAGLGGGGGSGAPGAAQEGGTGCGSGMLLGAGGYRDREDVPGRGSGSGLYRGTGLCSLPGLAPGPGRDRGTESASGAEPGLGAPAQAGSGGSQPGPGGGPSLAPGGVPGRDSPDLTGHGGGRGGPYLSR